MTHTNHIELKHEGGDATGAYLDGEWIDPSRSQAVWNHSPDGFSWGYGGSGAGQTALGLLLAAGVEQEAAVSLHQDFKWEFIAPLAMDADEELDVDVKAWAEARAQARSR